MVVLTVGLYTLFIYFMADRPGPNVEGIASADVVARVASQGRDTVTVDDPYDLDVITFEVIDQGPLLPDAPVQPPRLGASVEAVVFEQSSWWEDGANAGQLVVFLAHRPELDGPPWQLLFAVDTETGRITGEFDDDRSRDSYAAIARDAEAVTPQARIDALVAWAREAGASRPDAWSVEDLSTFYVGQAVAGDVVIDRDRPFELAAWEAQPADQRLLPVGPDDPTLEVLQRRLGLRSVAVAVRPNGPFDADVDAVAIEFVGTGLLGWIPLLDGQPTGLVGAAPAGEIGRVRVLGRSATGEVRVLRQADDDSSLDQSVGLATISAGRVGPGPWALVIEFGATGDVSGTVELRQTSIDELGLLMERAGR